MKNVITRLFGQRKFKLFVVICHPRTGSNLLLSYLGTHPHIKAQREIFKRLDGRTIREIYKIFMRKRPWSIKANGFKIFYSHPEDGNHEELLELIDSMRDPLIIHLLREDKFRTLVSWKIALKTDNWLFYKTQEPPSASHKQIRIEPDEALDFLLDLSVDEKRIHERYKHKNYLLLTYEQLTSSPKECLQKICSRLYLEYKPMNTNYIKSNPEPVEELVSNYQELKEKGILELFTRTSSFGK